MKSSSESLWARWRVAARVAATVAALAASVTPWAEGALNPSALGVLNDVWQQTGGPEGNWTGPCTHGWGVGDPCNSSMPWYASRCVVCNGAGNDVAELRLNSTNLTGSIPSSLGDLSALTELSLGYNRLTGTIPPSLGNLRALKGLDLNFNQLTGAIPSSLGNLTALTQLGLGCNRLTGAIPASLGNLVNLTELVLNSNQLTGPIPPTFGNLTALVYLGLYSNQLWGAIPPSLGNLTALKILFLSSNQLIGTIPSFSSLVDLTQLDLSDNQLGGSIPSSLGNVSALRLLKLTNNYLTGTIPASLGSLVNLTMLNLNNNLLLGTIPLSFRHLTALQELFLEENQLTGTVPSWLEDLTALRGLYLSYNQLAGSIPSSVGNLTALKDLVILNNQLNGTIPSSLGRLTTLQKVVLGSNQLAGSIPSSLGSLTALRELFLGSNQLSDTIPSSFGNLTSLKLLDLSNNNLNGTVPPSFGNLSALRRLNLNNNQLNGTTQAWSGNLNALTYLSISSNQLHGGIPSWIGDLPALQTLDLSYNKLNGTAATWVGNLSALQRLHLDSNRFSDIPRWIGNLTALTYVDISYNQLNGSIPSWIGNSTALQWLDLSNNRLGTIPTSIGDLTSLTYLDFSFNQVNGTIPPSLGNLTALTQLSLGFNHLTGTIPPSLGNLQALTVLSLSANQLTGTIPPSLGNLTALTQLYLLNNHLSGTIPSSFGNLIALQYLYLSSNRLKGAFNSWIVRLTALTELDLSSNQITGAIPPTWLRSLSGVTHLLLKSNQLSGTIPPSLGNLTALQHLDLSVNAFTGIIPPSLGNLIDMKRLNISHNQLTGTTPEGLGNLADLAVLDISHNEITGNIPDSVCSLTKLVNFFASRTQITGSIPSCIQNMSSLEVLSLREVGLTGELPAGLFELPRILFILMSKASFTGSIPHIDTASGVDPVHCEDARDPNNTRLPVTGANLSCSEALLHGCCSPILANTLQIPACYAYASIYNNLVPFDKVCNKTCGYCRPGFSSFVPLLRTLVLLDCGLSGEIPQWIGELPSIETVELSGNAFIGSIPTFHRGTRLKHWSAANNRLSGTLDPLQNATLLESLNVEGNTIGGTVGSWLSNRIASNNMSQVALATNHLSCDLMESDSEWSDNTTLDILRGNVFSCPVEGVYEHDKGFESYVCGSEDLNFAGYFTAASMGVCTVVSVSLHLSGVKKRLESESRMFVLRSVDAYAEYWRGLYNPTQLELLLASELAVATAVATLVLLPVYFFAESVLDCRYGWQTTSAFLQPTGVSGRAWPFVVAVFGGLILGGVVSSSATAFGTITSAVAVSLPGGASAGDMAQLAVAIIVFLIITTLLVGVNVGFVFAEESSHVSDVVKHIVVVGFAVLHELIDHCVLPLVVSTLATISTAIGGRSLRPSHVFSAAVALELSNSVLAPVIAQLIASEGCYHNKLFPGERVSTSAEIGFCNLVSDGSGIPIGSYANTSTCTDAAQYLVQELNNNAANLTWTSEPVATYTPPFRFEGDRCLSSIITQYTPEYLVIFALRMLTYPLAWWLARRGTPWIVAGVRPPVLLRTSFVKLRARFIGRSSTTDSSARASVTSRVSVVSRTSTLAALAARADEVLTTLHSIEPGVHTINLLAIAVCMGMLEPVIAMAAALSYVTKVGWFYVLDRRFGAPGGDGEQHIDHPMPANCFAQLLAVQSIYVLVVLSIAGTLWAGIAVVLINWAAFVLTCWFARSRRSGDEGEKRGTDALDAQRYTHSSASTGRATFDNPTFELNEPLIALDERDEGDDVDGTTE